MFSSLPKLDKPLSQEHIKFLETFTKSCRHSILEMVTNAQSGHPGGSLSSIDYLSTLYAFILGQTGEKIVISGGHISPAIYSILGEMGDADKEKAIKTFRKIGSKYEGHVTRHVDGIWYGTGPLGIGTSVASAFAWSEKFKKTNKKVYCTVGDGECQEGQVHEMMNFAKHHRLDNLIFFIDNNRVQLTASLAETMDIDVKKMFSAGGWRVIEIDAHNYQEIWSALSQANKISDKPVAIIGTSIMGEGVDFMEKDGRNFKADWHGKAPKKEQAEPALNCLKLNKEEVSLLENLRKTIKWHPQKAEFPKSLSKVKIDTGTPILYTEETLTDCRTAYGKALVDLAKHNKNVLAMTADLQGSVMTKFVADEVPAQHIECGIAEQHMVSFSGGLSLMGFIPFASTFGAFMSSRAKDQARVNDINRTNVKMVATHCGLSVGEDGPTHQSIDDAGSFVGLLNTMVIEPADPNHTDKIIRYIASHYGNFYVRMGRHKFPIITKENGAPFYDKKYKYEYGKCDMIRPGKNLTIAATGAMVGEALKAREALAKKHPKLSIEIIAVSSIKKFDSTLINSIKKTKKVITVEDHNPDCGLGAQLAKHLKELNIETKSYKMMGVKTYQLSGTFEDLYHAAKIDAEAIAEICEADLRSKFTKLSTLLIHF